MIVTETAFVVAWESSVTANGCRASAFSERQLAVFPAVDLVVDPVAAVFVLVPFVVETPAAATFCRGIRAKCAVLRESLWGARVLSYATKAR